MALFINEKEHLVTEAIDGILSTSDGMLTRLDGYPHIKVVLRTDWDKSKVALLSGGGSGHEPAHAGFIGKGMLTGAVCGEVFASPTVDAVLAGILAVTGEPGCLLIVKNYTGDRLNFGLAAERAKAMGYKVEMVFVGDDVAIPDIPQPRGVAGTLFVHKIAGAMAESGLDLKTIASAAHSAADKVMSIGMSLDTCSIPGLIKENRIGEGKAELGLGIHGEPGVQQINFSGAEEAMTTLLNQLKQHSAGTMVALVNNLGGTMPLEMSVLVRALESAKLAHYIIGPSQLMTSLDMHGFSISLMSVNDKELAALKEPVTIQNWPGLSKLSPPRISKLPDGITPMIPVPSENKKIRRIIVNLAELLISEETKLNRLDAKSGDGDTGSTLATAARSLKANIDRLPLADLNQLFPALGNELNQTMGGSSGVILAIFFNAVGKSCSNGMPINEALIDGLNQISEVGGAQVGHRTLIDALAPALEALPQGIKAAASAARMGADHTATIHNAKAGRAAYVPGENLKGHNDPGAEAVAILFSGLEMEIKMYP